MDARARIELRKRQAVKESKKTRMTDLRSPLRNDSSDTAESYDDEEDDEPVSINKMSSDLRSRLGKRQQRPTFDKLPSLTIEVSDSWS